MQPSNFPTQYDGDRFAIRQSSGTFYVLDLAVPGALYGYWSPRIAMVRGSNSSEWMSFGVFVDLMALHNKINLNRLPCEVSSN